MPPKSRNYCFTLNNYDDSEVETLRSLGTTVRYLVFGREVGESGTKHLQGFVSFKNPLSFAGAKARISSRAHVEVSMGTGPQAADYCKKDGDFEEFGECPSAPGDVGRKTITDAINEAVRRLKSGESPKTVAEEDPSLFVRYPRILSVSALVSDPGPRREAPKVFWFYGSTGTGKSRAVFDRFGVNAYFKMPGNKWFDGYQWNECCVLDDFRASDFSYHFLLQLLDRYPFRVEMKGASVNFNSPYIVITTPFTPELSYQGIEEDVGQLSRRITSVRKFPYEGDDLWTI